MTFETLDPAAARSRLDSGEGWIYLDVRSVPEFQAGHVPGAYNVPIAHADPTGGMRPNGSFLDDVRRRFEPDTPLLVGCAMGGRSRRACEALEAAGFARLVNVDGGFSGRADPATGQVVQPGWQARGFPVASRAEPGRAYDDPQGGPR